MCLCLCALLDAIRLCSCQPLNTYGKRPLIIACAAQNSVVDFRKHGVVRDARVTCIGGAYRRKREREREPICSVGPADGPERADGWGDSCVVVRWRPFAVAGVLESCAHCMTNRTMLAAYISQCAQHAKRLRRTTQCHSGRQPHKSRYRTRALARANTPMLIETVWIHTQLNMCVCRAAGRLGYNAVN